VRLSFQTLWQIPGTDVLGWQSDLSGNGKWYLWQLPKMASGREKDLVAASRNVKWPSDLWKWQVVTRKTLFSFRNGKCFVTEFSAYGLAKVCKERSNPGECVVSRHKRSGSGEEAQNLYLPVKGQSVGPSGGLLGI